MRDRWLTFKDFIHELYAIFIKQRPTQLAAALAYYGLFSFAPVLFIARSIAKVFVGVEIQNSLLYERLEAVLGPQAMPLFQQAVDRVANRTASSSWILTLISTVIIIMAALGLFFEVQYSLNRIWNVPPIAYQNVKTYIQQQLVCFLMVVGLGLLMVIATALNFILAWLDLYIELERIVQLINWIVLLGLFTLAFGFVYKVLPNEAIAWRDVWLGAFLAALLMILGGLVFGAYIRMSQIGEAFSAAGALIVILVGMYTFAQIFLFGAMFTRVYALKFGSKHPRHKIAFSIPTAN